MVGRRERPIGMIILIGLAAIRAATPAAGQCGEAVFDVEPMFVLDPFSNFGKHVDLDGTIAVVGAPGYLGGGTSPGAAFVFRRSGNEWALDALLDGDPADSAGFGTAVAIDNDLIAVVAPNEFGAAPIVSIFRESNGVWPLEASIAVPIIADGALDASIDVHNGVIAVGFPTIDRAFALRDDGMMWSIDELNVSVPPLGARYGDAVGVRNGIVLVSAPNSSLSGVTDSGAVFSYVWTGSAWVWNSNPFNSPQTTGSDFFGEVVAMDGSRAAIDADVFEFDGMTWVHLDRPLGAPSSVVGVDIDGDRLAYSLADSTVSTYIRDPVTASWSLESATNTLLQTTDDVALFGDRLIVGAPMDDVATTDDGAAMVIRLSAGLDCNLNGICDDVDIDTGTSSDCLPIPPDPGPSCNFCGNDIPDECDVDFFDDCNGNGIPDVCDLVSGSPDENGDGVPDECQLEYIGPVAGSWFEPTNWQRVGEMMPSGEIPNEQTTALIFRDGVSANAAGIAVARRVRLFSVDGIGDGVLSYVTLADFRELIISSSDAELRGGLLLVQTTPDGPPRFVDSAGILRDVFTMLIAGPWSIILRDGSAMIDSFITFPTVIVDGTWRFDNASCFSGSVIVRGWDSLTGKFDAMLLPPRTYGLYCRAAINPLEINLEEATLPVITDHLAAPTPAIAGDVLAAVRIDADGVNNDDIAVVVDGPTTNSNGSVILLLNDGANGFSVLPPIIVGDTPIAMAAGEFGGPAGAQDLVIVNRDDATISILLGNGDGTFTVDTAAVGAMPSCVDVADVDGVNGDDIVVGNAADDTVSLFINDGTGVFRAAPVVIDVGDEPISIAVADVIVGNGPDLLVGVAGNDALQVFPNSGGGTYPAVDMQFYDLEGDPLDIDPTDTDDDRDLDVMVSVVDTLRVRFLEFDGGEVVSNAGLPLDGAPGQLENFDFDGDGDEEIAVLRNDPNLGQFVDLMRNDTNGWPQRVYAPLIEPITTEDIEPTVFVIGQFADDAQPDVVAFGPSAGGGGVMTTGTLFRNRTGVYVSCPEDCSPDNGDGTYGNDVVNIDDLFAVIQNLGVVGPSVYDVAPRNPSGAHGNEFVNVDDLFGVINAFGECP